ncbi:hypothetical protein O3M35_000046 [Rhynocoris fuscipes]|uniref:Uncharacterized protein n=1 Tax=Rhynocoris fuscipes TaxID=488301 RepID=A0AAW1DKR7_9HEMI
MQNYHVNKTSLSKLSANTGCRCTDCSGQCHIISNQPEQAAAWRKCAACMKNKYRTVRVIPRDHQDLMTECVRLKPDPNEEELIHKKHWERIVDDVSKDVQRELQRMPSKLYQYSESTKQRIVNERAEYNLYMKSRSAGVCPVRNDFIDVDNVDPLLYRFIDTKLWYKPEGKIETSNAEVRCMLDEGTSFKRFINSYLLMVKQGYCAGANRIETLELLYKYYKKMNTDVPSDLLRLKKLRDIKVQDRINETPMTSFARTLRSLSKLFKRSIWRRERFNKQIKKKFNISDETLRLAEYKGAVTFVEEDKTEAKTLKRLRSDYRSSKTGDDYIKELKLALIKKTAQGRLDKANGREKRAR